MKYYNIENLNIQKDSPLYLILTNNKFFFIEKAIELKEKRSIRMTKTMMGNNPWNKGKKCPSLSIAAKQRKPVSKETRLKMSLSAKGRPSPNKGRKMSEEQKAKLRITGKIARQKQLEAQSKKDDGSNNSGS